MNRREFFYGVNGGLGALALHSMLQAEEAGGPLDVVYVRNPHSDSRRHFCLAQVRHHNCPSGIVGTPEHDHWEPEFSTPQYLCTPSSIAAVFIFVYKYDEWP